MDKLPPLRVLLVDSSELVLRDLTDLITKNFNPVEIKTTGDGEYAINIFCEFTPQVVITEILLTKMNGWDICLGFRMIEKQRKTPPSLIISLSSIGFELNQDQSPKVGIDYCYEKPLDRALKRVLLDLLTKNFREYS